MWLFTKHGFFSAVQHRHNPDVIHVRARFKGDLERLLEEYTGILRRVQYTPDNDYPYRVDFTRGAWATIVQAEAQNIDYENFKNEVHDGTKRDQAYMDVWAALRRNQDEEEEDEDEEER